MISKLTISVLLTSALVTSCSSDHNNSGNVQSCVDRGVAYFKEIGSYPMLSSAPNKGRSAEDVARERCNRATTAF